ncbi:hypothetical protein [Parapedobacter sp.]
MEKDLENLIWKNPKAAELISQNFPRMVDKIKDDFRELVKEGVTRILPSDFVVETGSPVSKFNSQIWIRHNSDYPEWKTCYGIETFSGFGYFGGQLICGIMQINENSVLLPKSLQKYDGRGGWIQYMAIKDVDERDLDFADMEFLSKLGLDATFRDSLVDKVVDEFRRFFGETKEDFLRVFKTIIND